MRKYINGKKSQRQRGDSKYSEEYLETRGGTSIKSGVCDTDADGFGDIIVRAWRSPSVGKSEVCKPVAPVVPTLVSPTVFPTYISTLLSPIAIPTGISTLLPPSGSVAPTGITTLADMDGDGYYPPIDLDDNDASITVLTSPSTSPTGITTLLSPSGSVAPTGITTLLAPSGSVAPTGITAVEANPNSSARPNYRIDTTGSSEGHNLISESNELYRIAEDDYNFNQREGAPNIRTDLPFFENITDFHFHSGSGLLLKDGEIWIYGDNSQGQLGTGNTTNVSSWTATGITGVSQVSLNYWTSYYVKDNTLYGTGRNEFSQLGQDPNGNGYRYTSWIQIMTDVSYIIGGGFNQALVVKKVDGSFWVMGRNPQWYGADSTVYNDSNYNVKELNIKADQWWPGYNGCYAKKADGSIWRSEYSYTGWGEVVSLQGLNIKYFAPAKLDAVLFIKDDDTLWGWGDRESGVLGDHTIVTADVPIGAPVQIDTGGKVYEEVYLGSSEHNKIVYPNNQKDDLYHTDFAYGVDSSGKVWRWGGYPKYSPSGFSNAYRASDNPVLVYDPNPTYQVFDHLALNEGLHIGSTINPSKVSGFKYLNQYQFKQYRLNVYSNKIDYLDTDANTTTTTTIWTQNGDTLDNRDPNNMLTGWDVKTHDDGIEGAVTDHWSSDRHIQVFVQTPSAPTNGPTGITTTDVTLLEDPLWRAWDNDFPSGPINGDHNNITNEWTVFVCDGCEGFYHSHITWFNIDDYVVSPSAISHYTMRGKRGNGSMQDGYSGNALSYATAYINGRKLVKGIGEILFNVTFSDIEITAHGHNGASAMKVFNLASGTPTEPQPLFTAPDALPYGEGVTLEAEPIAYDSSVYRIYNVHHDYQRLMNGQHIKTPSIWTIDGITEQSASVSASANLPPYIMTSGTGAFKYAYPGNYGTQTYLIPNAIAVLGEDTILPLGVPNYTGDSVIKTTTGTTLTENTHENDYIDYIQPLDFELYNESEQTITQLSTTFRVSDVQIEDVTTWYQLVWNSTLGSYESDHRVRPMITSMKITTLP